MGSWEYLEAAGWVRDGGGWKDARGVWYETDEAVDIQTERDRTRMAFVLGYESHSEMMAAIGAKVSK